MVWQIVSAVLGLLLLISLYAIWNLNSKVVFYEEWYRNFANQVELSKEQLEEIDNSGAFESDDDVGYFFKFLKDLMRDLYRMGFFDEDDIQDL